MGSIPHPEDTGAQIVQVLLTLLGVGTLFYALVTVTEFFVGGHLAELLEERRTRKMIDSLSDHYLICGFGRVGRQVARDLRAANAKYVVVDSNPENRELAQGIGVRFIEGEPSEDEMLRAAGIEKARGVIACVDSDAENIFITLTARQMRPDINIVARAAAEDSEGKLRRARRRPRDLALQGQRRGDGAARPASRRSRASSTSRPSTGWRRSRSRPAARARA